MIHAQKYINTKEVQAQLWYEEERSDKKRDTEERKSKRSDWDCKRQDHRFDHKLRTPPPTYWNFMPLNTLRSEVLMQIRDHSYVRWPEMMKTHGNKRNHDKYCEFHRYPSHDKDNCFDLCNRIEDLIRHGYLGGFVDKNEKPVQEECVENARPQPRAPPASVIHVISGGIAARGESSSGCKKYARLCEIDNCGHKKKCGLSITFTDNDLWGVQTPHDDALVIIAEVSNFEIRLIMVDIGSSVDVLFEDVFEKLDIDKNHLTSINTPLMGLSGESLLPTGRITLPL
ncbi:PREDICTED: uncharacterized protein LOC104611412 [Nelumbo nucifera]|uniref:Uncharacterized protein LOC104611412 n=1 Tax=Nelumbo nucifera TaxID=4432 RepID=A0A1U8B6T4_NELNU|nr:PREDICTED: uncharacterized protein LOC104611412 [Nelumbo nucifera]